MKRAWAALVMSCLVWVQSDLEASQVERVIWDNKRIEVIIPVGVERTLEFEHPVNVAIRPVDWNALQITTVGKVSFWKRRQATTKPIELQVFDTVTGQAFLFAVITGETSAESSRPIRVFAGAPAQPKPSQDFKVPDAPLPAEHVYETLTRFAAQRFYAPVRLHAPVPGITAVDVQSRVTNQLIRGGEYIAIPKQQWRLGAHYLTAIELTNNSTLIRDVDLTQIRAEYITAAAQLTRLLPHGTLHDRTHLYLISTRPFDQVVYPEVTWRMTRP